jgi:fucose permease
MQPSLLGVPISRALWATRMQFMVLGTLAGTWGAHIASVKAVYALSEASLSLVLLGAAVGAVAMLGLAGRLVARLGARNTAAIAAMGMCAMLGLALEHGGLAALLVSMLGFGAAMSLFDVAINTEGSELESLCGRAIMSNLHGMFSVGGMLGAALVSGLLNAGVPAREQLFAICGLLGLVAALASRGMLQAHGELGGGEPKAHFAWPRGQLLVLGLLIFAGMTAEGVMYDWSVLYLKQDLGMPQSRAALGYAAFSGAMALARFCGDWMRSRYSERSVLRWGASVSMVSMAVVLLSGNGTMALFGFALAGVGLAPVAPILFNAATRVPGVSRAAAIASVTSIGYSGFMIGPPLIGSLATVISLGGALGLVVVASALLAYGSRYVPETAPSARASGTGSN